MRSLCILFFCLLLSPVFTEERIVGGTETEINLFPYQLSLHNNDQFICGASLIRKNWAITAAHCTKPFKTNALSIRAGSTFTNWDGEVVEVETVFIHKQFDDISLDYDVSLLKLKKEVTSNNTETIDVVSSNSTLETGEIGVITGWGSILEDGELSLTLQTVEVMVVDHEKCKKNFESELVSDRISDRMFCAGVPGGGKDACQGDSGGPFVITDRKLAGIISWGRGCARSKYPGVYTNLAVVADFVEKTLEENQ